MTMAMAMTRISDTCCMDQSHRATLRVDAATTSYGAVDGDVTRHPQQHFLDFVLDGHSLRELAEGSQNLVTPLCSAWMASSVAESVEGLLGRSGQPDRAELLVCEACGDLGCGGVTARLSMTSSTVTWSDLLREQAADEGWPLEGLPASVAFARDEYEAAFADAEGRVAASPRDELAHRGRRFLWPWQWGWLDPTP